ncbi:hypothetical protein C7459_105267 [Tumebacillus permanentifrigoris]|uniref:Uncharacterized protein n=1 Tax=Tumebacillus permanentifrigoris TaxID=378543 RepID=A0A316DBW4_9BACL|nr:hypothetical protein C7459_105267 [Tumebacillus permanentifrigoris]
MGSPPLHDELWVGPGLPNLLDWCVENTSDDEVKLVYTIRIMIRQKNYTLSY